MNFSTPISTLWDLDKNANLIMEYSDSFEGRPFNNFKYPTHINDKTLLFHCDVIQPIHKLNTSHFDYIKKITEVYSNLKIISFHCAYRTQEYFSHNGITHTNGYLYSEQEMRDNMRFNINKIKQILNPQTEILIENNNYYPTNAYDIITDPKFISDIINENKIGFLFDHAHAQITAHNKKIKYKEYIKDLPLDKCKQIHLCKMGYEDKMYSKDFYLAKDLHICPDISEFNEVKNLINKWNSIEYITIEYYKDIEKLISSINKLKHRLND